ncbi:MAG: TatD family deoxyribonuclease [Ketobacter sp.]|nr:MAG: TatD family deoxyribonuclease [Ketobacter sp.]
MLQLIDSHCHLDFPEFDQNRAQLIQQCRDRGMLAWVVPGVSHQSWPKLRSLARDQSFIKPAFGLHPYFMQQHELSHLDVLPEYLDCGAIAVGEIGLDAFDGSTDTEQQMAIFKAQLAIAKNQRLPVIVHSRKTQDLIFKAVRELHFQYGGIMHAFSGSLQQAQRLVDSGFLIGFGGAASYDRAIKLHRLLRSLPRESIALETDSPDISPSFARDQMNTPVNLFKITEILAARLDLAPQELARQTSLNVIRLLELNVEVAGAGAGGEANVKPGLAPR